MAHNMHSAAPSGNLAGCAPMVTSEPDSSPDGDNGPLRGEGGGLAALTLASSSLEGSANKEAGCGGRSADPGRRARYRGPAGAARQRAAAAEPLGVGWLGA